MTSPTTPKKRTRIPSKRAAPADTASGVRWSSEGGWEARVAGSALRERPSGVQWVASKSVQAFVATLPTDPLERATEVMHLIDRANEGHLKKADLDMKLALAWRLAVCEALGWEAVEVRDKAGRMATGLVTDPERRWTIDPRALMRRLLGLSPHRKAAENTALLLYNMIVAGRLPPARPGDYLRIG